MNEDIWLAENQLLIDKINQLKKRITILEKEKKRYLEVKKALQEKEEMYRAIVEGSHDAIYIYRGNSFLFFNENVSRLTRYSSEELSRLNIWELIHPEDRPQVSEYARRRFQGEKAPAVYEARVINKEGEVHYCEFSVVMINVQGEKAVLGAVRDITPRKKIELALRESEDKFRKLAEDAQVGVYLHQDGVFRYINPCFAQMFGYEIGEIVDQIGPRDLCHPEDWPLVADKINARYKDEETTAHYNFRGIRKDGTVRTMEVYGSRTTFQQRPAIIGMIMDVTSEKEREKKLQASLKEKEVLLQEIHHRVKNNMQIISSLLRLQARQANNPQFEQLIQVCQNRIRSMALIHEKFYETSDFSKIDFNDYARRLLSYLLAIYIKDENQISLEIDIQDVFLDINKAIPCGLLINEIVSNSLKHAFPGGRKGKITLKMKKGKSQEVELVIADNGVGFPGEIDFQKTATLGLQLVKDLVRQLNGRFDLIQKQGIEYRVYFNG
jgi:PAS domain S-box-containing protein